jgi:D-alanyl-D-alanine carboxypeptidase
MTADWAGGGLISTAEDLNRFLRAFARNEIFEDPTTRDEMFNWVDSGPFHNYGLGLSRVLFNRSGQPQHAGLAELWGHTGSSDNFMYYWPDQDVTLIGTLNQIACERDLYDNVALIMKAIIA